MHPSLSFFAFSALWLSLAGSSACQNAEVSSPQVDEDFKIYSEHPRLFLNARRLRLLGRERERDSLRWRQLAALIEGKAQMAEPGFAYGLYYRVSGSAVHGKLAVDWALGPGTDLRQLALVFDWCQALLTERQSSDLAAKIRRGISAASNSRSLPVLRDRALALVATAGHGREDESESQLKWLVQEWWRKETAPALLSGRSWIQHEDVYPLFELLHAVRDNTNIDLRENAARFFKELPAVRILGYYPASFPAPENEFRIPFYNENAEPDLRIAALSRAADLSIVAFDTNALENQYLQGWLIHDRFLMRGVFGIVYEFLWANPYQPGLSYYHLPLSIHDGLAGRLMLRSSWDDTATWFHFSDGKVQVFDDGVRKDVNIQSPAPIDIAGNTVRLGLAPMRFTVDQDEKGWTYIIGLKPNQAYDVEIDDQEMQQHVTDRGGILAFEFPPVIGLGVRVRESPKNLGQ